MTCRFPGLALAALLLPLASVPAFAVTDADVDVARALPSLTFSVPTVITTAPGMAGRLYVATQAGRIQTFVDAPATAVAATMLDISDRVSQNGFEEGLLGLTFDPDFATNRYLYVNYVTRATPRRTIVSRFRASADGLSADPATERVLLEFAQPFANHNGGWIGFGPDKTLYIGSGDGGRAGDGDNNGQRLDTPLGKVLRIRGDGSIPADNPFVSTPGARGEIWAYGLRNPFAMSFDEVTGRLWAVDVGASSREEVNLIARGANYGWRVYEGTLAFNNPSNLPLSAFTSPVHEYTHDEGCSIVGGVVYRGTAIPALQGHYVFSDFCSRTLWALDVSDPGAPELAVVGLVGGNPSGFGTDGNGEVLITTTNGRLYRLVPGSGATPDPFPELLSQTGLFSNTAALQPAPSMEPYLVNAPFWSDRALKQRWFALPTGGRIGFQPLDAWSFPAGTRTVKHFDITLATGERHRLETRVFVHTAEGWRGATYRWNDAQTDARVVRQTERETLEIRGTGGNVVTQSWEYPSQSACLRCHTEAAGFVLGLETPQLNRGSGTPGSNQIDDFRVAGLFEVDPAAPSEYPRLANPTGTRTLSARARAYLDVNCSQCHRPGGPTGVDMDLRWNTPRAAMRTAGVPVTGTNLGIAGAQRIVPGDRSRSVLWQRMRRLDAQRMPPVGSHVVHGSGVKLIGDWIDAGAN